MKRENEDYPAFAAPAYTDPLAGKGQNNTHCIQLGMTKREYFAGQALAGIKANRWTMESGAYSDDGLAEMAVSQADALINALNEPS